VSIIDAVSLSTWVAVSGRRGNHCQCNAVVDRSRQWVCIREPHQNTPESHGVAVAARIHLTVGDIIPRAHGERVRRDRRRHPRPSRQLRPTGSRLASYPAGQRSVRSVVGLSRDSEPDGTWTRRAALI